MGRVAAAASKAVLADLFAMAAAASAGGGAQPQRTWIPVDVKLKWFSFLSAPDLARCGRTCKSWASLVNKTADAEIATTICAPPPMLSRAAKLHFLHRLHNVTEKENMGYLLSWAAGCRGEQGALGKGRKRRWRAYLVSL